MWCQNYSVAAFSHYPEHRPPSFCQTPRQHCSMPCWTTTTQKPVEKVHFNGRNQIGRPVTLTLWGGSRLTRCIVKTSSLCLSSHDEDANTFQFQPATIFTATLLFQPQLITTLYLYLYLYTITNYYKSAVCCFTHMRTDIISYTA